MWVQRDGRGFTVEVTPDGEGLVSHAGAALVAEAADRLGLTRALVARAGGDARAAWPPRSRAGRPRPGGDARRRRGLSGRSARGPRSAAAVRGGGVGRDGVSGDRRDRRATRAAGRAACCSRAGARERLAGRRSARADHDRYRRDADQRAFREGGRGRATSRAASGFTRCWRIWTRRARRWPACCGPATPARTPPPTTSTVVELALEQLPRAVVESARDRGQDRQRRRHARVDRRAARSADRLPDGLRSDRGGARGDPRPPRSGWRPAIRQDGEHRDGAGSPRSPTSSTSPHGPTDRG